MRVITRIRRQGISDSVYDALRQAILQRVFHPGERLDVDALAKKFDVSAMPVRQAVQRLATEGLMEVRPRSGTYVARLSARDVAETFDIRRALECLAAETAVQNVDDSALRELRRLVIQVGRATPAEHGAVNAEFHRQIILLSGNQRLVDIYDQLNAHLQIARIHESGSDWSQRKDQEEAEHEEICAAVGARDPRRLSAALARHIERAKQVLIADLETMPS